MRQIGNIKIGHFVKDEKGTTWQINCHYTDQWRLQEKMTTLTEVGEGPSRKLSFKPSKTKMEYLGDFCFVNGKCYVPTNKRTIPFV